MYARLFKGAMQGTLLRIHTPARLTSLSQPQASDDSVKDARISFRKV